MSPAQTPVIKRDITTAVPPGAASGRPSRLGPTGPPDRDARPAGNERARGGGGGGGLQQQPRTRHYNNNVLMTCVIIMILLRPRRPRVVGGTRPTPTAFPPRVRTAGCDGQLNATD